MKFLIGLCLLAFVAPATRATTPPNIVFILADDMGWGDLKANFPDSRISTPNLDRLAATGMRFSDAHSASAVCTPTRYGVLTGRYCWRSRLKKGVLGGWSPTLIEPDRPTVASFLKSKGYATACLGKWHLGMNWSPDSREFGDGIEPARSPDRIDFTQRARGGPDDLGFDHWFGISASLDMPPYAFIRSGLIEGKLTARKKWIREGPATPDFEAVDVLPTLNRAAVAWLEERTQQPHPFFLYLALPSPHTPVVPSAPWQGRSPIGPYGDFVMETDAVCGSILDALDRLKLSDNTVVIFTSDNGATPDNPAQQTDRRGHLSHGPWRGTKADIWEGGHRVPFLARWPGHTPAGSVCHDPISLNSLFATAADLCSATLPADAAPDSFSIAPHLRGESPEKPTHPHLIHHSISGMFAIRRGPWKFIDGSGSGGWSKGGQDNHPAQLYHLGNDPAESKNLFATDPTTATELQALLHSSRNAKGSR